MTTTQMKYETFSNFSVDGVIHILNLQVDDRSPLHDMSTHSHHSHHSHHSYSGMGHGHPGVPGGPPMGGGPMGGPPGGRRDSDLSDAFLSPEAYRATQAVEFIAEHLRNEDEYVQVCFF